MRKINKIVLKKDDALAFFGGVMSISRELGISSPAVSKWPDIVPEQSAWALLYVSKLSAFRKAGNLNVEIWR